MGIFIVVFMFVSWSSVFSLGKYALENSPPVFFNSFSYASRWSYFADLDLF